MHLESQILVHRSPAAVWGFLGSVDNVAKWDRGVARTARENPESADAATQFSTFARADSDWGKMTYQIVDAGPDYCTLQLVSRGGNARFVRNGYWTFRTELHSEGTLVHCSVDFSLKLRYLFLAPLLYLNRSAIHTDLESLKRAIENLPAGPPS